MARSPKPIRRILHLIDWFESRGVYVPGEDNQPVSPWRDFGWLIATWLVTVSIMIIFFAVAG